MNYRIISGLLGAFLLSGGPAVASEQQDELPAFDSFSFYRDPLFGAQRPAAEPASATRPVPDEQLAGSPKPLAQPEEQGAAPLSQNERYELQLALDKALSQILKLTVDYEALRSRVENVAQERGPATELSAGDFASAAGEKRRVQALMDLNSKRLADRDEQIALLNDRLEALQARLREMKVELTASQLAVARQGQAPQAPDVKELPRGYGVAREQVVEGLQFEEGSARIASGSLSSIAPLLERLRQNREFAVQINGYTDNLGSADANLRLSKQRAEAVADYLVDQGIDRERIMALGFGEQRPIASNETEQGRVKNRRVAILLLDQNQ